MNCQCVHAGNSAQCRAIECAAYLWAVSFRNRFMRRFLLIAGVVFVSGALFACNERRGVGSAFDEFYASPLPESPVVVYHGENKPSLETMQRLVLASRVNP